MEEHQGSLNESLRIPKRIFRDRHRSTKQLKESEKHLERIPFVSSVNLTCSTSKSLWNDPEGILMESCKSPARLERESSKNRKTVQSQSSNHLQWSITDPSPPIWANPGGISIESCKNPEPPFKTSCTNPILSPISSSLINYWPFTFTLRQSCKNPARILSDPSKSPARNPS